METNNDASVSKRSAVDLGYWDDPYISAFASRSRRPPLINRGYFARVHAIEQLLDAFLRAAGAEAQVVSLGAGFDTTFFRLLDRGLALAYFEVDMPEIMSRKRAHIARSRVFARHGNTVPPSLRLLAADLRDASALASALEEAGLDKSRPVFILMECVLAYLGKDSIDSLLRMLASFPNAVFVAYDPFNGTDSFGQMMVQNLEKRGACFSGICDSLPALETRLTACGWTAAQAMDMNSVYARIPHAQRSHAERIEFLDELEEWRLIMGHYAISVAVASAACTSLEALLEWQETTQHGSGGSGRGSPRPPPRSSPPMSPHRSPMPTRRLPCAD